MNVHFMIPGENHSLAGGAIYNQHIINGLREKGHQATVHELDNDFPFPDDNTLAKCRLILNNIPEGDAVVIDSLALGSLLPVLADFYGRNPFIAMIHVPFAFNEDIAAAQRDILAQQEKNVLSMSSVIVVTSNYTAKIIAGWLKFPPSIYVVPPGVEIERRKFYWPPYPQRLICVSNYMPNKGQYILLKALTSLKKLNWKLVCYGNKSFNPRYVDSLMSVIDKYGLGDRVELNEAVSGKELENAYVDADLCVLPSYFETYGMVLSEALAHGIPVVASTGGGIRDTVPISMGLFFKPGDISELQSVIRTILTDSWLYQRLCSETALYYKKAVTWNDSVNQFEEILKEALQNFK